MRGFLVFVIISGLALSRAATSAAAAEPEPFGLGRLHTVHIEVSAANYAAMESPPVAPFGGGGKPPGPGRPAPGSADFGAGKFGFEFDYVHAAVEIDGQKFADVGLRYKGNGTYMMSAQQAKRSVKIDFDRFVDTQVWLGEKKLNLNSGVMDPTKAREALAYTVFQAVGVPASRTAFAEVTLSIPGKYDRELLGVYTAVEQVDKAFLKTHFQSSKGLLLKPEGIRGLPHFGANPKVYEETYNPKTEGSAADWQRLVELTRLINVADEGEFREKIGAYLDLDSFARFLAVNTYLASLDGFLGMGHNYYLYLQPESKKFTFIPWDLDLAFGAFPFYGTTQQLIDLSIEHPHLGENKLIDRLLTMPEFKANYRSQLQTLAKDVFTAEKLGQQIAQLETLLAPLRTKDKQAADARKERAGGFGAGPFGASPVSLTDYFRQRTASVQAQLAGEKKGYVPTQGMGFGAPPPNNAATQLARPLMTLFDADKDGSLTEAEATAGMAKLVRDWDKNNSGSIDQRELTEGLQKLAPPPGAPAGPPGRPPGGPPGGPPPGAPPGPRN